MKMNTCMEIGKECGLTTIEECYNNIRLHAMCMFTYDKIAKEILELQQDIFYHNPDEFCRIFNTTKEKLLSKGWITKE